MDVELAFGRAAVRSGGGRAAGVVDSGLTCQTDDPGAPAPALVCGCLNCGRLVMPDEVYCSADCRSAAEYTGRRIAAMCEGL